MARGIGDLVAEVTTYLTQESGKPRGGFIGTPKDGEDETIDQLRADAAGAKGALLFVESQDEEWEGGGKSRGGWNVKHFGPSIGQGMVEVAKLARAEALAALGVHEALFSASSAAALREAWRLGPVQPDCAAGPPGGSRVAGQDRPRHKPIVDGAKGQ